MSQINQAHFTEFICNIFTSGYNACIVVCKECEYKLFVWGLDSVNIAHTERIKHHKETGHAITFDMKGGKSVDT